MNVWSGNNNINKEEANKKKRKIWNETHKKIISQICYIYKHSCEFVSHAHTKNETEKRIM